MILTLGDRVPSFKGGPHFVAYDASIIGSVELAAGASVWFGAVLRADNDCIRIGRDSNIQDGAVLHTDPGIELIVGERVTVGHRAVLHGCEIGDSSLIGIGSTVLNRARIGRYSIVGANALITEGKEFPDGVLIAGAPGRVVRELTDEERRKLEKAADIYVRQAERYLEALAPA